MSRPSDAISIGRGLDPDEVRRRIDQGPYPAKAAQEAGLIDACLYPDDDFLFLK